MLLLLLVLEFIIIMWEYFNSVCCVYMRLVSLMRERERHTCTRDTVAFTLSLSLART